jgi:murein DD-endopeptidase MepM/ murein hydrolase activator NlpD
MLKKLVKQANCQLAPKKLNKSQISQILNLKILRVKELIRFLRTKKPALTKGFFAGKFSILSTSFGIFLFVTPTFASNSVFSERVLPEPVKVLRITDRIVSSKAISFSAPLKGSYISTFFSLSHRGIDIPDPAGTVVKAVSAGTVTFAGYSLAGYGNLVIIQHQNGFSSLYAHLSTIQVKSGQVLAEGQSIGTVGATGNATGNHLHIEIHLSNRAVNPLDYFNPL